jgi:hypothetical protein
MNNIHQIPCLESAELIESWNEEEKIPVKKSVPVKEEEKKEGEEGKEAPKAEQEFEIKQRVKTATYPLKFDTQVHSMAPAVRQQFCQLEKDLTMSDRKFLDLKEAKNDLESYSYEFRNNLGEYGNYEKHALKEVREPFIAQINEVVDWLYGAGETATLEEYTTRLNTFKQIGGPIKKRYVFYSMIEESIKIYDQQRSKIETKLADADMTDENRKAVIDKCEYVAEFFKNLKKELETRPRHEDASVTLEAVN